MTELLELDVGVDRHAAVLRDTYAPAHGSRRNAVEGSPYEGFGFALVCIQTVLSCKKNALPMRLA